MDETAGCDECGHAYDRDDDAEHVELTIGGRPYDFCCLACFTAYLPKL